MEADQKLLNFVYQNSEMGAVSVKKILSLTEDENFVNQLRSERTEYLTINAAAKNALARTGCDEKGLSGMEKLRTYLMIDLQSLSDKSTPRLAKMMVLGSTMGIVDAKEKLREHPNAGSEAKDLMQKLCTLEERNVDSLKGFL